jgi:FixJ family two-component response regulator
MIYGETQVMTMNAGHVTTATHPDEPEDRHSWGSAAESAILLVDDDDSTVEALRVALEQVRCIVLSSSRGQSVLELVRQHHVGLIILDYNLPDISGLDVMRRLAAEGIHVHIVLVSGFLNVEISVEAMKLGAYDVLEKPLSIERLLDVVHACNQMPKSGDRRRSERFRVKQIPDAAAHPGSAAHRWAVYVLKACEAETDLKTLYDWARCAGVSYSMLAESCRIMGIRPHAARDFMRTLRAMIRSTTYECEPSVLLDVSDRRTLRLLLERAGPSFRAGGDTKVDFIRHQRFVPTSNEGIRVLLGYFDRN